MPVTVTTDLDGVTAISLFVDANPSPLAASFEFAAGRRLAGAQAEDVAYVRRTPSATTYSSAAGTAGY